MFFDLKSSTIKETILFKRLLKVMIKSDNSQFIYIVVTITTLQLRAHKIEIFKDRSRYRVIFDKKIKAT